MFVHTGYLTGTSDYENRALLALNQFKPGLENRIPKNRILMSLLKENIGEALSNSLVLGMFRIVKTSLRCRFATTGMCSENN